MQVSRIYLNKFLVSNELHFLAPEEKSEWFNLDSPRPQNDLLTLGLPSELDKEEYPGTL